jgi:hypothetical protein
MKNYSEFHDGYLEGLWTPEGGIAHVFIATDASVEKKQFTAVMSGVVMLRAGEFREGNIILEVLVRDHDEITVQDIGRLYELAPGHTPEDWEHQLLERARNERMIILEINPSYGASCLVLGRTVEFLKRADWTARYI